MPTFTYKMEGKLEDLVRDEKAFGRFAAQVRRDNQSVLDGYEIADKAAHRDLLAVQAQIDFLEGRYADAARRAEEIRALEEKPADKLISGLAIRTMVAAQAKVGNTTSEAYRQEVGSLVAAELAKHPYAVIANDIKSFKSGAEIIGEALLMGGIRDRLQPVVDKAGGVLSSDFAPAIVAHALRARDAAPAQADPRRHLRGLPRRQQGGEGGHLGRPRRRAAQGRQVRAREDRRLGQRRRRADLPRPPRARTAPASRSSSPSTCTRTRRRASWCRSPPSCAAGCRR